VRNVNPEWYYGWDQEPDDEETVTESDEEES